MQCVDLGGRRIIKKIFFKQKTAYEISACLVGSEMCIRDRLSTVFVVPMTPTEFVFVDCTAARAPGFTTPITGIDNFSFKSSSKMAVAVLQLSLIHI